MTVDLDIPKPQINHQQPEQQPSSIATRVTRWPAKRQPEGLGISFKDGWNFGIGLGLAFIIAIPIILAVAMMVLTVFAIVGAEALGTMLGGL